MAADERASDSVSEAVQAARRIALKTIEMGGAITLENASILCRAFLAMEAARRVEKDDAGPRARETPCD